MYRQSQTKELLLFVVVSFCCWNSSSAVDKPPALISEDILNQLKNASDYESFESIIKTIDLKSIFANPYVQAGFKKLNLDVSMLADVKMDDLLKVFNLRKVYLEVKTKDKLTINDLLGSLYMNVNTMALFSNGIDWAKLFQDAIKTGGIQLPGMTSRISLECSMDVWKIFSPLMNLNFTNLKEDDMKELMKSPAVKMLDAITKIPSGILGGNLKWWGAYDECQTIKSQARYCKVGTTFLKQNVDFGTCMPRKCSNTDVAMLHVLLGATLFPDALKGLFSFQGWALCDKEKIEYSNGFIVTVVISTIIMLLLTLGTFVDLVLRNNGENGEDCNQIPLAVHKNKKGETNGDVVNEKCDKVDAPETYGTLKNEPDSKDSQVIMSTQKPQTPMVLRVLQCFSLLRNIKAVLATDVPKGAIECINGIRTISMFWVILGHVYAFAALMPNDNMATIFPTLVQRFTAQSLLNAYVSVDSFFLLSGLLVSYLTLKRMDKNNGKINFLMYYLHRFIRLTPPYMFVILFWNNIFPYMIKGPNGEGYRLVGDSGACNKYWWTNLLYINNFHPKEMEKECLGWSWYLSNDMQFYIIAPLVLYLMYILERKFKNSSFRHVGPFLVVLIGSLVSIMIRMILIGVNDYPALISKGMFHPERFNGRQDALYIKPYTRISPYLVGLFLGYVLSRDIKFLAQKRLRVKFFGWVVAILLGYAIVYGPYANAYQSLTSNFNKTENVLYGGFSSFVWAIAVSWVIYACHYGFGGLINSFLSWRFWIPLSRLTFGAYLLHPLAIFFFGMSREKPYHMDDNIMPFDVISMTVMSYGASFILAIGLEYPVLNLEKIAFKQ